MTDDGHTDAGIDERTTDDTEEGGGSSGQLRRTVLGTLLGLGGLGVVGTTPRASAAPPKARPWNQDVDAQGNDLFNLGSLAMAANETEIYDFEGENLSIDDGILNVVLNADVFDADTLDGVDWDDVGGRYLQWNTDEQVLEFTGPAEWGNAGEFRNTTNGKSTTVAGGVKNTAESQGATVGGGKSNTASGLNSTVGGGWSNSATGNKTTIAGGVGNRARKSQATVAGGGGNKGESRRRGGRYRRRGADRSRWGHRRRRR